MSMDTSFYAEYAEEVRMQWSEQLREAFTKRDWCAVESILIKMETPTFGE